MNEFTVMFIGLCIITYLYRILFYTSPDKLPDGSVWKEIRMRTSGITHVLGFFVWCIPMLKVILLASAESGHGMFAFIYCAVLHGVYKYNFVDDEASIKLLVWYPLWYLGLVLPWGIP